MQHKGTIKLETERLILRPFLITDAKAMYSNWASDSEVTKLLTWPAHKDISVTERVLQAWIQKYDDNIYYQSLLSI